MDWHEKIYETHGIVSELRADVKAIKDTCPTCQNKIQGLEKVNNIKYGIFLAISAATSLIVTFVASFIQAGKIG